MLFSEDRESILLYQLHIYFYNKIYSSFISIVLSFNKVCLLRLERCTHYGSERTSTIKILTLFTPLGNDRVERGEKP